MDKGRIGLSREDYLFVFEKGVGGEGHPLPRPYSLRWPSPSLSGLLGREWNVWK